MTALRVEQWSATQAQQPMIDSLCTVTKGSGKPSLLDTLKAAAQEAALQAAQRKQAPPQNLPQVGQAAAPSNPLTSPDLCPRPQRFSQEPSAGNRTQNEAAAATAKAPAAAKLGLKPILLKRPASKLPRSGVVPPLDSPASPQTATAGSSTTRFAHRARSELGKLEMDIPWEAVHRTWKIQRAQWRKALRQAETVAEVTGAMRELRDALSIPGSPFSHYGGSWDQLLSHCSSGAASLEEVGQLLSELQANARAWLKVKDQELPELGEEHQGLALRGLEALWQAVQCGPLALTQCPLEAILDYDEDALQVLKDILQREIGLQSASAAMGGAEPGKCPAGSVFACLQEQSEAAKLHLAVCSSGESV